MELVKPSIERLELSSMKPLGLIEQAGRVCYKSEVKGGIAGEKFVIMLRDRGHHAMLEHSWFTLQISEALYSKILRLEYRPYLFLTNSTAGPLISGNARAFMDMSFRYPVTMESIIRYLNTICPCLFPTTTGIGIPINDSMNLYVGDLMDGERLMHQCYSYKAICDRGVTHEIVRHRPFSYAQESTRYCNYKSGCTFIIPPWLDIEEGVVTLNIADGIYINDAKVSGEAANWLGHLLSTENYYKHLLLSSKWIPEKARSVLPNALKTEIIMTGNLMMLTHFFKLRCAVKAHPQMQEIANMICKDML